MELSKADKVWNRAAVDAGGPTPRAGDKALAGLLHFDSLVCNGGLGHGFDVCSKTEIEAAIEGFRYFFLSDVADFLIEAENYSEEMQEGLSAKYYKFSETISDTFEAFYRRNPEAFAPVLD